MSSVRATSGQCGWGTDNVFAVCDRTYAVSKSADPSRNFSGGANYISSPDQKWRSAATSITAYGSNLAGFAIGLKSYFFIKHLRKAQYVFLMINIIFMK